MEGGRAFLPLQGRHMATGPYVQRLLWSTYEVLKFIKALRFIFSQTLEHVSIDLKRLFDKMESIEPQKRPSCLEEVRRIQSDLPPNVLSGPLPEVAPTGESQIIEPTTRSQTTLLIPSSQDVAGEVVANTV